MILNILLSGELSLLLGDSLEMDLTRERSISLKRLQGDRPLDALPRRDLTKINLPRLMPPMRDLEEIATGDQVNEAKGAVFSRPERVIRRITRPNQAHLGSTERELFSLSVGLRSRAERPADAPGDLALPLHLYR